MTMTVLFIIATVLLVVSIATNLVMYTIIQIDHDRVSDLKTDIEHMSLLEKEREKTAFSADTDKNKMTATLDKLLQSLNSAIKEASPEKCVQKKKKN